MRHLRRLLLAILTVALCGAPAARADAGATGHGGHAVTPSRGALVGESWAQLYSLPTTANPLLGNGDPCLTVGHRVVEAVGGGPCTIEQGTGLLFFLGSAWSNAEAPYPADETAQRAVAQAADRTISEIRLTVDDGEPIDIHTPRFELFSPQRTVQLSADNILGVPAQTITFTVHGWSALVHGLPPGPHTIFVEAVWDGQPITAPHFITVVRSGQHAANPQASSSR